MKIYVIYYNNLYRKVKERLEELNPEHDQQILPDYDHLYGQDSTHHEDDDKFDMAAWFAAM